MRRGSGKPVSDQDLNAALIAFRNLQWHGIPPRTVNRVLRSLHIDTRKSVTDEERKAAFAAFDRRRLVLLNNTEMPIKDYGLTAEEFWWQMTRGKKKKGKPGGKPSQRAIKPPR